MKTATVREVQHRLAHLISQVQKGQEFAITKRGKVVARIVPSVRAKSPRRLRWPDSVGRMKRLMSGATITGVLPSELIAELRGERV